MSFDPILAEIRFGCGLSPNIAPTESVGEFLAGLDRPDEMADRFPIESFPEFRLRMVKREELQKEFRKNRGTDAGETLRKEIRLLKKQARLDHWTWMASQVLRRTHSQTPFKERIEGFWADHFTTAGKAGVIRRGVSPFVESAIRPNMSGSFSDLLIASVTHPLMVHYLDQDRSAGPNSRQAKKKPGKIGLNENLAREILELHTLGVDGPYTQGDVRELAELLTGLTFKANKGRHFQKSLAEPGEEIVLGTSYGGDKPHIRDIHVVLRDLAVHPATARHMATKLATHFVSDRPDPDLVAAIERVWRDSDGELSVVYEAMLRHPMAWTDRNPNFKQPFEFVSSAARALNVHPRTVQSLTEKKMRQRFFDPLRLMGHIWQRPSGPDGLDEDDSAWITPQGMAARLQWAVIVPSLLVPQLPDPREFVQTALGSRANDTVRFAAGAAESRADGIGLVLISPAFQRT